MIHFINEQAEKQYYLKYGRWPKPSELRRFMRYGQKSKPVRRAS